MDEKGFAQGLLGALKVVCDRRQLATEKPLKKHCGTREWVSIIECICADGEAISPHLIFAGKLNQDAWLDMLIASGIRGGSISATESGWTNNEIGMEWLSKSFESQTKQRQRGQYRCILLDGHGSHLTPEAIQFCINNKIIMICLPSHSTHLLQPLDVGIFLPMTTYYKGELEAAMQGQHGYTINKLKFIQIFCKARAKTMTSNNIFSAWKDAGLFPHCPDVVLSKIALKLKQKDGEQRPSTPPEGSVTITAFNGASVTFMMSPEKADLVNECVGRFDHSADREAMMRLTIESAQAIADAHIYKQTNQQLLEAARQEQESKSHRKGQNSKAKVLNEWIRSEEYMQTLLQQELKMLGCIHLDILSYSTVRQKQVDQIDQATARQAEQAMKEAAKEAAKEATKYYNTTCRAFRSLDPDIFILQSFQSSPRKSPQKSSKKTVNNILDGPHLPPSQSSPARASSPILLPPLSPTPTLLAKRRKAPRAKTTRASLLEEEETPIEPPRISRLGRAIRPPRRLNT